MVSRHPAVLLEHHTGSGLPHFLAISLTILFGETHQHLPQASCKSESNFFLLDSTLNFIYTFLDLKNKKWLAKVVVFKLKVFKMIQPGITLLLILAVFSKCLSCFLINFAFLLVDAVKCHVWVKGKGQITGFFLLSLSSLIKLDIVPLFC